ncbi:hypothetical protein FHG87_014130, partial [Trinorchestia longiramus]
DKVQTLQQKNVFLLVDEVQIRPTVSISGVLLSGMAENNRDCKATSILITSTTKTLEDLCDEMEEACAGSYPAVSAELLGIGQIMAAQSNVRPLFSASSEEQGEL